MKALALTAVLLAAGIYPAAAAELSVDEIVRKANQAAYYAGAEA